MIFTVQRTGAECFTTEQGHPNQVGPSKRPYHTIIPGFVTRIDDSGEEHPAMAFGVMGGFMQPQGHAQVMVRLADYNQNPQAALDAPRWRVDGDTVWVELETPRHIIEGLIARGHTVQVDIMGIGFGRGQIIWRQPAGTYVAGSEPRCDGCVVGW